MNKYDELKRWLDGPLDIPQKKERRRTLMDIVGIEHLENNWSKIYAYFFDFQEDHGMGKLFVKALLKTCGIDEGFLNNPYVETEHTCKKDGKRIDILLVEGDHAVIIENKVHHVLNNDLNNYYEEVTKTYKCDNVKVVVLGLHKYNLEHNDNATEIPLGDRFSITHEQLMENMQHVFKEDMKQWKFNYLFNEFYQNIKNMTNESIKNELEFFESCNSIERTKIYDIAMVYNKLISYLDKQMKCKTLDIEEVRLIGKHENDYVKYIIDGTDENMMLTILYRDRLLIPNKEHKDTHILIVLELKGYYMNYMRNVNMDDYKDYFNDHLKDGIEPSLKRGDGWMHFAFCAYHIEMKEAFRNPNLATDIIKESGMLELAKKIRDEIKKHQS